MLMPSLMLLSFALAGLGAYVVRRSIEAENAEPIDLEN